MNHIRRTSNKWTTPPNPFRSSTFFIIFVIAFAVFTEQFVYAAIVPVVPFALVDRGHISEDEIQIWTTVLLAVSGAGCFVSSPFWSWYTDRTHNRRIPLLFGMGVMLGATVLLWLAPNMAAQVCGRVFQGMSSTVVWTTGLALLAETVQPEHVGEAAGYLGISLNAGTVAAPALGGMIFKRSGYDAVFAAILGVIGLGILFLLIMKEREPIASSDRPSFERTSENTLLQVEPKTESEESTSKPDESSSAEVPSTQSSMPLHSKKPAMIRILFSSRFLVALWGVFTLSAVFAGFETVLPITVNELFGWDAESSGAVFLPLSLPAIAGPLIGKLTDKYGGRWFLAGAFLVLCPALVILRVVDQDTSGQKAILIVLLLIIGCCLAIILEPLFGEIAHRSRELAREDLDAGEDCPRGYYGQAYGFFNMAWALGDTLGPLLCGFVVEARGWAMGTLALGVLCGVTAVPVVMFCDGWLLAKRTWDLSLWRNVVSLDMT
ncbi:hypothetical protein CERZMDRAFT_48274 [Cercospora zeae-maydis SCOH1-5]|uniref:Major facilitator superfamily (MFS) profile domain-containing protein n=1 Tax=Cercospora zeae-maydis SCOH1-5 TaxID=717836 RepID=A0A6A6F588_9PEZI|nr:hypothetical protein CERZMDRAFT_48274 [Cercospora zeae-maydis SCOH1-5]